MGAVVSTTIAVAVSVGSTMGAVVSTTIAVAVSVGSTMGAVVSVGSTMGAAVSVGSTIAVAVSVGSKALGSKTCREDTAPAVETETISIENKHNTNTDSFN